LGEVWKKKAVLEQDFRKNCEDIMYIFANGAKGNGNSQAGQESAECFCEHFP
jgi:hypothetical protein